MSSFFFMVRDFYSDILSLFGRTVLDIGGVQTSLGGIIFACIVVGFVVNLYWRGTKS